MKNTCVVVLSIFCAAFANAQESSWESALNAEKVGILYAPDYVDTHAYFQEGDELLTENVNVSFGPDTLASGKFGYRKLWYRELAKKHAAPPNLDPKAILRQMGISDAASYEKPVNNLFQDEYERFWNLFEWTSKDDTKLRAQCLVFPQAYVCLYKKIARNVMPEPIDKGILSRAYVHHPYWSVAAVEEFQRRFPEFPVLSDVEFVTTKEGKKDVHFKTLRRSFPVDLNGSDMIRILAAMVKPSPAEKPKWIAFGYSTYKKMGDAGEICKMEIDAKSSTMKEHFELVRKNKIAKRKNVRFKTLGKNLRLWTTCSKAVFHDETDLLKLE